MGEVPFPWIIGNDGGFPLLDQEKDFEKLPNASSCRKIDFDEDKVEVRPGFINDTWFLIVSGIKPYSNMKVELMPVMYVRKPEYWGIEVVGCIPGIGKQKPTPYTVFIPIDGVIGTEGIEVVGASKNKKLKVPPGN